MSEAFEYGYITKSLDGDLFSPCLRSEQRVEVFRGVDFTPHMRSLLESLLKLLRGHATPKDGQTKVLVLHGIVPASSMKDRPFSNMVLSNDAAVDFNAKYSAQEGWRLEMSIFCLGKMLICVVAQLDAQSEVKFKVEPEDSRPTDVLHSECNFILRRLFKEQKCLVFRTFTGGGPSVDSSETASDESSPLAEDSDFIIWFSLISWSVIVRGPRDVRGGPYTRSQGSSSRASNS
jgi:hypothetical protein